MVELLNAIISWVKIDNFLLISFNTHNFTSNYVELRDYEYVKYWHNYN